MRRRFKLRRNAKGSNHPTATFFLNPSNNFAGNDVDGHSVDGGSQDTSGTMSTLTCSSSSTALQR